MSGPFISSKSNDGRMDGANVAVASPYLKLFHLVIQFVIEKVSNKKIFVQLEEISGGKNQLFLLRTQRTKMQLRLLFWRNFASCQQFHCMGCNKHCY
jgi:hypothetical protein